MHPTWSLLIAGAVSAVVVLIAPLVLRRLPPPRDLDHGPVPWAHLPTRGWLLGLTAMTAVSSLVGLVTVPQYAWPLWWVWSTPVAILVAIDATTTWLPLRLTQWCWVATALSLLAALALGAPLSALAWSVAAAAACGGFFWLFWWVGRGRLGFGDVRLAPMVGAVGAVISPTLALWSVFLAAVIGVALGVIHQALRRSGGFPYGPALWAGPVAAAALIGG